MQLSHEATENPMLAPAMFRPVRHANDWEESLAIGLLDSILCLSPVSAGGLKWISGF